MVHSLRLRCDAGFQAASLLSHLSTPGTSLQSVEIVLPPEDADQGNNHHWSDRSMNLWHGMRDLAVSSSRFETLREMYLEVDESVSMATLAAMLMIAPNLSSLRLQVHGQIFVESHDDPELELADRAGLHNSIRELTIEHHYCAQDDDIPELAQELLYTCPKLRCVRMLRRMEPLPDDDDDLGLGWTSLYHREPWFHAVKSLEELQEFVWHDPIIDLSEGFRSGRYRHIQDAFERVEHLTMTLPNDDPLELMPFHFADLIPSLPRLQSLTLITFPSSTEQEPERKESTGHLRILPQSAIRAIDNAPCLIKVHHEISTQAGSEGRVSQGTLLISTLQSDAPNNPILYLTQLVDGDIAHVNAEGLDLYHGHVRISTRFRGAAVPLEVIRRMARLEGVGHFEGRGVEVSSRTWEALEEHMAAQGGQGVEYAP